MRWCDLYEVEDERGGSVPHAALAFGRHAVGLLQCVPVGDAPRALRVPTLWGTVWGCCSASPLGTAFRDGLVLCSACPHVVGHRVGLLQCFPVEDGLVLSVSPRPVAVRLVQCVPAGDAPYVCLCPGVQRRG